MQTYVQRKTEQKKKPFTVYSSVYVYIYIFIFKLLLCFLLFLNHYTLFFYLSHVNLQLKSWSKWRWGAWRSSIRGHSTPPPLISLDMRTWAQWKSWTIAQSTGCVDAFVSFLSAVAGSQKGHTVLRLGILDVWHLASDIIVNSKTAWVGVYTVFGINPLSEQNAGHHGLHFTPCSEHCYEACINRGVLGCVGPSFSLAGFGR